jgi:hypothetical protein
MPNRVVFRGGFKVSDNDGTVYPIDLFEIINDLAPDQIRGPVLSRTADGDAVKRAGSGRDEIEQSGAVPRSAPERASGSESHAAS